MGLLVLCLSSAAFLAQAWAMRRHGKFQSRLGLTGGEIARHILDASGASYIIVSPVESRSKRNSPRLRELYLERGLYESTRLADLARAAREAALMNQTAGTLSTDWRRRTGVFCRILVWGAWTALLMSLLLLPLNGLRDLGLLLFIFVFGIGAFFLPVEFEASERAYRFLKESKHFQVDEANRLKILLSVFRFSGLAQIVAIPLEKLYTIMSSPKSSAKQPPCGVIGDPRLQRKGDR